jgi:hypothetical protein
MRHQVTLAQFPALIMKMEPEVTAAVVRGLRSAALRAKGEVVLEIGRSQPYPAVDTGGLRESVNVGLLPDGGIVTVDAPHAAHIEHGTRPFWPPMGPLLTWAIRKGLADDEDEAEDVVRRIQAKIAREGIEPRHFFAKAMATVGRRYVPQEINAELKVLEDVGF